MRIAFIGLGNMGGPMAGNLVKAGHEVAGVDPNESSHAAARELGIDVVDSAAEAVRGAQVVFTMLPSGKVVTAVVDSILDACDSDAVIVDSSTIDVESARALHERIAASGRRFLDAPVSGGIGGAAAGTLTFMVGGDEQTVADVREVIEAMAGKIFHVGGPGAGQSAKACNNLMLAINTAGLCEAATLADRLGLDPQVMYELAQVSSGDSWALRTWYPVPGVVDSAGVNRDFDGGFSVDLFAKDLGLALDAGASTNTPLEYVQRVRDQFLALSEAGYGNKDCSILVRLIDGTITTD
ncbi:MAG TPA: 3-hydroxyisobutyrate dehydrogenase [Intrasporangiaceae bacterium]|nr:3-hydroxyisobutyrate dehydrogenase [Intrasporangiaceae bacterium]